MNCRLSLCRPVMAASDHLRIGSVGPVIATFHVPNIRGFRESYPRVPGIDWPGFEVCDSGSIRDNEIPLVPRFSIDPSELQSSAREDTQISRFGRDD